MTPRWAVAVLVALVALVVGLNVIFGGSASTLGPAAAGVERSASATGSGPDGVPVVPTAGPVGGPGPAAPVSVPIPVLPGAGPVGAHDGSVQALFSVSVHTRDVGPVPDQPELVSAIDVPSHVLVVPPVPAGTSDWRDTSVWVQASAFPTAPSTGTSYVYGHACSNKICPFTALRITPGGYSVQTGDQVAVTTAGADLTYTVCGVGSSSKAGDLVVPPCGVVPPDLVVVTCAYENGASLQNLVVAATLTAATTR